MALPEFQNEAEFRDNWIAPFLAKLGYILIKNTHGTGEQGKDFFFADYDRFGFLRVWAAQVKVGNIGSGSTEIAELLDQVKRCFGVRLRFHKGAHAQRVAGVYVMTSGKISDTARERIHDWCVYEKFGENVFFVDGEQLDNKNRFATYESDTEKREHFAALKNELARNLYFLERPREDISRGTFTFPNYRINVLEDALRRSSMDATMVAELEDLWHFLKTCTSYVSPLNINWEKQSLDMFTEGTVRAIARATWLDAHCDKQITELNQRYSLATIEVTDAAPDATGGRGGPACDG